MVRWYTWSFRSCGRVEPDRPDILVVPKDYLYRNKLMMGLNYGNLMVEGASSCCYVVVCTRHTECDYNCQFTLRSQLLVIDANLKHRDGAQFHQPRFGGPLRKITFKFIVAFLLLRV